MKGKAQLPHHYLSAECSLDEIPKLQKYLADNHKASVSTLDIVTKAAAIALRQVPEANAVWENVSLIT